MNFISLFGNINLQTNIFCTRCGHIYIYLSKKKNITLDRSRSIYFTNNLLRKSIENHDQKMKILSKYCQIYINMYQTNMDIIHLVRRLLNVITYSCRKAIIIKSIA